MSKFSIVLITLFVMVSGLVSATAYVSNNQAAFVKADTILSIDFGNVFPGIEVTESFTISSIGDTTYNYTLELTSAPLAEDMCFHMLVWKDSAEGETEPDAEMDGREGDFSGEGSFTNPGDLSDKWFVTFFVPDVTLPSDTAIDYGCQISIVPDVDFNVPPLPNEDRVLMPDGMGYLTQFQFPDDVGSHWEMVNDAGSHDGDVTCVSDNTSEKIDLYEIEGLVVSGGANIDAITLWAVMRGGDQMTNGYYGLQTGGTQYWGNPKSLSSTYGAFSRTYLKNPKTGSSWTVSDINALQVGFYVDSAPDSGLCATQIFVVVHISH